MPKPHTRASIDPRARLGRRAGRRFLVEWGGVGCFGLIVILLGAFGHLGASADRFVYDRLLSLRAQPLRPDIVVVEIDNASVAQLGGWPWPRSVHAKLLEAIAQAKPAAVIYDVLFTGPNAEDAQLARAIALSPTYLPMHLMSPDSEADRVVAEPVAALAQAAAGVGHDDFEADSDGIVRSVAQFEGEADSVWPQLTVPLARAVASGTVRAGEASHRRAVVPDDAAAQAAAAQGAARLLIPFGPNAQRYPKFTAASVLAGDVPAAQLRGRLVLVGVTASGVYPRFTTPVSGALGPMPGIYLHADVLDTLLTGREIDSAGPWMLFAVSLAPLAALLAGFLNLSPRRSLLLTAILCVLIVGASAALLYGLGLWMSPVPAIVALIMVYPLWNWRRLETTVAYLHGELQSLADEPRGLPQEPQRHREFGGDVLERPMALMKQTAQRLRDTERFVWHSLDSLPEPMLVSDAHGTVLMANQAAQAHFARLGATPPDGRQMKAALGDLTLVKRIDGGAATATDAENSLRAQTHWPAPLDPTLGEWAALMAQGVAVRDGSARDHWLRYANYTDDEGATMGWIASLVDISALQVAERQREDALRLLSHDMRSPQASIIALVERQRARAEPVLTREWLERIERYAREALTLADDFVQLARAESQVYDLEPVDLSELMIDASDEVWPQAHAKRITLDMDKGADQACWICADRSLMTRVLVTLLNDAVRHSPRDARVSCHFDRCGAPAGAARVSCTIRHDGAGIPEHEQAGFFEPSGRVPRQAELESESEPESESDGAALDRAFVKTVVTRHGGEVQVSSASGGGAAFTIWLPQFDDAQTGEGATPD
ncbi:MAG TPA: CHASE2 domain-containing protein [Paraburkholderia sp.]|nr:CHASE2 domain-containing protein [Paraburkholderia sp.]